MTETDETSVLPHLQKLITESKSVIIKLDSLTKRFDNHIFTKEEIVEIYEAWVEASRYVIIPQIWFTIPGTWSIFIYNNPQELKRLIDTWDEKHSLVKLFLTQDQYTLVLVTNTWERA